jgi:hypothetical protein
VPEAFRAFAGDKAEWSDVLALLPESIAINRVKRTHAPSLSSVSTKWHQKFEDRPTYGDPIDFRGLRHAPVNEAGVIFLFGMVAKELGYFVEVIQAGFPDCEAKRQIAPGKWQRVRIEFEFESRAFEQHGHRIKRQLTIIRRHNLLQATRDQPFFFLFWLVAPTPLCMVVMP